MRNSTHFVFWKIVCLYFGWINAETEIVIAGLFPSSHDIDAGKIGRGVRPAVQLSIDMVNNDTALLPGYKLRMKWNDSQVRE